MFLLFYNKRIGNKKDLVDVRYYRKDEIIEWKVKKERNLANAWNEEKKLSNIASIM